MTLFGEVELLSLDELAPQFEWLLAELQFVSGSWPVKDPLKQAVHLVRSQPCAPHTFRTVRNALNRTRIFLDGTGENGQRARDAAARLVEDMQVFEAAARLLLGVDSEE